MDLFQKPGHILTEDVHGLQALFILGDLADLTAKGKVPAAGADDHHFRDRKKMIQGYQRHGSPRRGGQPIARH